MALADIDHVLLQLGQFGRFQVLNYIALSFPIFFSAIFTLTFVFTASDLDYRCRIPECENGTDSEFLPDWIYEAVPFQDRKPSPCQRYAPSSVPGVGPGVGESCADFDEDVILRCSEWVYSPNQMYSVAREWNITCEDRWQLALPGTVNNIGLFFGLPFAGFISDRFGRKRLLVWSWLITCCMGMIRSFATSIPFMATFEFLDAFFGAGVFSACFILGLELVGPDKRVLGSTLLSLVYSLGQVFLGLFAMWIRDWRSLLHSIYFPAFLCLILLWPAPESVRWLASKGRFIEADSIIKRAAKFNKVTITDMLEDQTKLVQKHDEAEKVLQKEREAAGEFADVECAEKKKKSAGILRAFKSPTILARFLNCAFNWAANTFVYYGLSLNSVVVEGNEFVNFILVSVIEMPAIIVQLWMLERFGRRTCLCSSLLLAGAACISFIFIPSDMVSIRLMVFLCGKFGVTISFAVLYMYTAELFPTNVRHSLLGACSMFGRVGSMLAPQTPVLGHYMESLPLMMFGIVSFVAAGLSLFFPETKDQPLPDTVEDAEKMGQKETSFPVIN